MEENKVSHDARGRGRGRVLIVDDEPALLSILSMIVGEAHEVVSARSGQGALDVLARDGRFDVVLCDLTMPSPDGIDVYEEICRTRPELAKNVVFMTGGAFTPRVRDFVTRVPNRCLEKPFEARVVCDLVSAMVARDART